MVGRVAEHAVRTRLLGPKLRFRVDLHGVARLGPGEERTLIRWEWMQDVVVDDDGRVLVKGHNAEVRFPPAAFGLSSEVLAERLRAARSIERRPEVIGELGSSR